MSMMMNVDLLGLEEDLSLFASDDLLKATAFSDETASSDQYRHAGGGYTSLCAKHDAKSELQKLLEGTSVYRGVTSEGLNAEEGSPPTEVGSTQLDLKLCDAELSWSNTMVDLLDLTSDVTSASLLDLLATPTRGIPSLDHLLTPQSSPGDPYIRLDELDELAEHPGVASPYPNVTSPYSNVSSPVSPYQDMMSPYSDSTSPHSGSVSPEPAPLYSAENIFADMLSLCVDMPNAFPDTSYQPGALSPVSVEDIESLLASEPSSPIPEVPVKAKRHPRSRKPRPYEHVTPTVSPETRIQNRKLRKKEQNKVAALRYREKKRAESGAICDEEAGLETRNVELHDTVDRLEQEVAYLKDLMAEVVLAKGRAAAN